MSDLGISNIQDEDQVEITDLDEQEDGSSASLSLALLKLARKMPLLTNSRTRITSLAWMACMILLLFLVQPGLPGVQGQTSRSAAHEIQYPLAVYSLTIKDTSTAHTVTWIRISNGQVITVQAAPGSIVWHHCKLQRWFTPPKYAHPTVVLCT